MNTENPIVDKPGDQPTGIKSAIFASVENGVAFILLILLAVLPLLESILRSLFHTGISNSSDYMQHLVLWICFVGGMITSREGRHLNLSAGVDKIKEPLRGWIRSFTAFISVTISLALALASLSFVFVGFDPGQKVGFIPMSIASLIMPAGFLFIMIRFITHLESGLKRWVPAALGILTGLVFGWNPLLSSLRSLLERLVLILGLGGETGSSLFAALDTAIFSLEELLAPIQNALSLPLLVLLILSAALGTPIFIILGGAALLFFVRSGGALEIMPNEAYTMLTGTIIPAIPLFALVGFILSESKAGERLVRLFRALFGWLPGGLAVMSVLVCAFFTTFTGGSGVTILALGALLSFVLLERGYKREFSTGLLTGSGSIGLLFPPSLPIIMYGVVAQINIKELFVGGLLPGVLMILTLSVLGIRNAVINKVERVPFRVKEVLPAVRDTIWEILLPIIILLSYFLGITTLVETAALAVVYVLVVQVVIHRDIKLSQLPAVFAKCIPIIGGILIILAVAKGLSYFIVDAQIPTQLTQWSQAHIQSKIIFLILLNLALLVTGCLMDIYSAITVVAPLVVPLGVAYGIHPVHLGIIFLANLELGYLTPPVGLNLFLASYRFNEPLVRIYRYIIPFLVALLVAVLCITYVPWLTTALLEVIKF